MKSFRSAIATFVVRTCRWRVLRTSGAHGRWPALALQWRRPARAPAAARGPGARRAAIANSITSVHLHWSSVVHASQVFAARARPVAATPHGALINAVGAAHGAARSARPPAAAPSSASPTHMRSAPFALAWLPHRTTVEPHNALPFYRRYQRAAPGPIHPAHASRASAAPPAWKAAPSPAHRAKLRAATAHPVVDSPPRPAVAMLHQPVAPALIWSRPAAAPSHRGIVALAAVGQTVQAGSAETPRPVPAPAEPAAPSAAASLAPLRQQLRAGALDPLLSDRLADEVIRRVERSMRIERERRGR